MVDFDLTFLMLMLHTYILQRSLVFHRWVLSVATRFFLGYPRPALFPKRNIQTGFLVNIMVAMPMPLHTCSEVAGGNILPMQMA